MAYILYNPDGSVKSISGTLTATQAKAPEVIAYQKGTKYVAPAVSAPSTPAPPASTAPAPIAPPTIALQPGSTNAAAVKQLQDYLVSQGLMSRAQVNTGYGTYGPQTTAAVAALQKKLGVDNSTGVGYFGPKTLAALRGGPSDAPSTTTGTSTTPTSNSDPALEKLLSTSGLSDDQKSVIRAIHDAVATGDAETSTRLKAAMEAAKQFSEPYFKAQIRLATDALDRGLSATEGDLASGIATRQKSLQELKADIAASKDNLSFQSRQELEALARDHETKLETEKQNLAATGFTSSTRRQRSEDLINKTYGGAVESTNRSLAYQTGRLDRQGTSAEQSTAAEIENLRRLAAEGKLTLLRKAEETVGTKALADLGFGNLLGDVGGTIPHQQVLDENQFASSFVF